MKKSKHSINIAHINERDISELDAKSVIKNYGIIPFIDTTLSWIHNTVIKQIDLNGAFYDKSELLLNGLDLYFSISKLKTELETLHLDDESVIEIIKEKCKKYKSELSSEKN